MNEVDEAIARDLVLNQAQTARVIVALTAWVRTHTSLPDGDARVTQLLRGIADVAPRLQLRFDEHGVVVDFPTTPATLLLDRGSTWLRSGTWQNVVVAAVSSETPTIQPPTP